MRSILAPLKRNKSQPILLDKALPINTNEGTPAKKNNDDRIIIYGEQWTAEKHIPFPTNKVLYTFLHEAFPDLQGFWPEFPHCKYSKEYLTTKLEEFRTLLGRPTDGVHPTKFMTPQNNFRSLSELQLSMSSKVCDICYKGYVADAIHEFMDCIDCWGETVRNEREITPNEHALYYSLATLILQTIKYTIV